MAKPKQKLLVIEPNQTDAVVLQMMFREHFDVTLVSDNFDAIKEHDTDRYHLVLLNTELPDQCGLRLCERIINDTPFTKPAVVVLSDNSDEEHIRKAYDIGVADYFFKPFNVIVLHETLLQLSRHLDHVHSLENRERQSVEATRVAMTQSAAYGSALEVIADLNNAHSEEAIARKVIKNLAQQGIQCALQLRSDDTIHTFEHDREVCAENVVKTINLLKDHGRVYRFGRRLIMNDSHASLLVKSVPGDRTELYDSILDVGAKMICAINMRYKSLLENRSLHDTHGTLLEVVTKLQLGLKQLTEEKTQFVDRVAQQIQQSFHSLEMTERQEQFFNALIEQELQPGESDATFEELNRLLEHCLSSMTIIDSDSAEGDDEAGEDYADVELF